MSTETNNASTKAKRNAGIAALVLLAVGGVAWWFFGRDSAPVAIARTPEEAARGNAVEVRVNGVQLTEAELKKFEAQAMTRGHDAMSDMVRKYTGATPAEKKKMLDEQIDAQEKIKKEMGDIMNGPPSTQPGAPGMRGPDGQMRTFVRRSGGGEKGAMENLPPDIRAAMQQYRADMNQRRAERGLPPQDGMMIIRRDIQVK
jgi:hypothetical protein